MPKIITRKKAVDDAPVHSTPNWPFPVPRAQPMSPEDEEVLRKTAPDYDTIVDHNWIQTDDN